MAQRVQIQLIDDLTGEDADETVTFGLDGTIYEIDLTTGNADRLREELGVYLDKARKAGSRAEAKPRPAVSGREETRRIRQWAQENGYNPSDRGRINKTILEAYKAANS